MTIFLFATEGRANYEDKAQLSYTGCQFGNWEVNRDEMERPFVCVAVEDIADFRVLLWKPKSCANEEIISVILKSIDTSRQLIVLFLGHYVQLGLAR